MIYAADSYALAMLAVLAHAQIGAAPPHSRYVEIDIPDDLPAESIERNDAPGWDKPDYDVAQALGRSWIEEARTAILLAPSVVAPVGRIVVMNPAHPEAARITPSAEQPVTWNARLAGLLAR